MCCIVLWVVEKRNKTKQRDLKDLRREGLEIYVLMIYKGYVNFDYPPRVVCRELKWTLRKLLFRGSMISI